MNCSPGNGLIEPMNISGCIVWSWTTSVTWSLESTSIFISCTQSHPRHNWGFWRWQRKQVDIFFQLLISGVYLARKVCWLNCKVILEPFLLLRHWCPIMMGTWPCPWCWSLAWPCLPSALTHAPWPVVSSLNRIGRVCLRPKKLETPSSRHSMVILILWIKERKINVSLKPSKLELQKERESGLSSFRFEPKDHKLFYLILNKYTL